MHHILQKNTHSQKCICNEQDFQSTVHTYFVLLKQPYLYTLEQTLNIRQITKIKRSITGPSSSPEPVNPKAMPLSQCHPAYLGDHRAIGPQSVTPSPTAPPGGLTSTRPSALGCRARLTPIHSSSRSSRQVFPHGMPRFFPGWERGKPDMLWETMSCGLLFKGFSTYSPNAGHLPVRK